MMFIPLPQQMCPEERSNFMSYCSQPTSVFMLCLTGGGKVGSKEGGTGRGEGYSNEGT